MVFDLFHRSSRRALQRELEACPLPAYQAKNDGEIVAANTACLSLFNTVNLESLSQLLMQPNAKASADQKTFSAALQAEGEAERNLSLSLPAKDVSQKLNSTRTFEEIARVIKPQQKSKNGGEYRSILRDVTTSAQLNEKREIIDTVTEGLPGGLFRLRRSADGKFTAPYLSEGFLKTLGLPAGRAVDPEVYLQLVYEKDRLAYMRSLLMSAETHSDWNIAFRLHTCATRARWLQIVARPTVEADGTINWNGYLYDVTSSKEAEAQIEKFAFHDALTELPNRRLLVDRLSNASRAARRHRNHGALLFVDMDNFKYINDSQGHDVGDAFLQKVAKALVKTVRATDTVARYGGDEFLIVLGDLPDDRARAEANAQLVARKVLNDLRHGFHINEVHHLASCSIGIAVFDGKNTHIETIIKQADTAMYCAKEKGRNRYALFGEAMIVSGGNRMHTEN